MKQVVFKLRCPRAEHISSALVSIVQILHMLDGIDALRKLDVVFSVDNMTVCCNSLRPVISGMRITAEAQVKSIPKLSSFYNKQE